MKNFIEISDSEEEQVDKLKKWWNSNGKQIIAGAVLGLAGIFGWNAYVDYQDSQALNARALYLSYASDSSNVGAYDKLIKDHPSSSYADQGTLLMAKYLFEAGNYSLALDAIKPLMNRENSVIASTAILRTASLYLELGQHEEALAVLNMENANGFSGLFYNLAGDIYLDLGNNEEAKNNYALAIENISENSSLSQLIQIKLDDLN